MPAQEHQVPVAQVQQMPGGQPGAPLIVRRHLTAALAVVDPQIDAGHPLQQRGVPRLGLPGQGGDHHPVDPAGHKFSMAWSSRSSSWRELLSSTR